MTVNHPYVLVLNGGSSSGKSTLARSLQALLEGYWLRLGVDTLLDAAPDKLLTGEGIQLGEDGSVTVGTAFAEVEGHWRAGVAAMVRSGARVLVEDNFVSGPVSQQRWEEALHGLPVGWVGVACAPDVASAREAERGDRAAGMAALQAKSVHRGISYDLVVDTSVDAPDQLAHVVRDRFWPDGRSSETT